MHVQVMDALTADNASALIRAAGGLPLGPALPSQLLPQGRSSRGWTWLHAAAAHGAAACLTLLSAPGNLQQGLAAIDRRDGNGRTALLIAAEHQHPAQSCACVEALVRSGAKPHAARKSDGETAAHLSASAGCARCLRLLVQKAPHLIDVKRRDGGQPLHAAALSGRSECVYELLSQGAMVDARTSEQGASVGATSLLACTPLHLACRSGCRRTVKLLLEHRAEMSKCDHRGRTAIQHAIATLNARVVAVLCSRGADPSCVLSASLQAALRTLETMAKSATLRQVGTPSLMLFRADQTSSSEITSWKAIHGKVAQWSRVLTSLLMAGASVRSTDLVKLRLDCGVDEIGAMRTTHVSPRDPPSLFILAQRALAFGLTAEGVLETLHVARLVSARHLQVECERLVLQNVRTLDEAGIFRAANVPTTSLVRALLFNVLHRRVVAALAQVDEAAADGSCANALGLPGSQAEEIDPFCASWVTCDTVHRSEDAYGHTSSSCSTGGSDEDG